MAGVKGQANTSQHKRENQWTTGKATPLRSKETYGFRPLLQFEQPIKEELAKARIGKTEWMDRLVANHFGVNLNESEESESANESPTSPPVFLDKNSEVFPLVETAIRDAITSKEMEIARERKAKKPDTNLIDRWQREIELLESSLPE